MNDFNYSVQLDYDSDAVFLETPEQVFELLKKQKLVTILRYNDKKTGSAYAKEAAAQELTVDEQVALPVFAVTVLSEEGVFVESETFWVENYMFDEFYNPDRMPYIEKVLQNSNEDGCELEVE